MAPTGDVELHSHDYQVLRRPGKSPAEMMMRIHAVCPSSTNGMKDSGMEEIHGGRIRGMVRLWL